MNTELEMQNLQPHDSNVVGSQFESPITKKQRELMWYDVSCLIINKMIGTGIFVSPAIVVLLVGSKWAALLMWIFGACYSFASIFIYLEYGLAWPFNGGEFIYIGKILPCPSLVAQCSFAWFFVCFSTSVGNAISFARFFGFAAHPDHEMNEWLQKLVGCWLIVAICLLHYRLVNIGIWANNLFAAFKVLLVLLCFLIGLLGGLPKEGHTKGGIPGASDFGNSKEAIRAPANSALAIFLVLYSYQGWENANYVTAEIKGDDDEKRRILKKGALIAIAVVSSLYILLNLVTVLVLSLDEILDEQQFTVVYKLFLKSVGSQHPTGTGKGISVIVAFSALGNLISGIFTNGRVKREIAKSRLIPFSNFFAKSSKHGVSREGTGTPTGGLILHGLGSCIFTVAVPLLPKSLEGFTFILNTFTYGQSALNLTLAFGTLFPILVHRMNANSTATADNRLLYHTLRTYSWQILTWWPTRWMCAGFVILVNSFLVVLPFIPTAYTDGKPRRIPTWNLPVSVLPVYVAGAVAGFSIAFISINMSFLNSRVDEHSVRLSGFVYPKHRRWEILYPEFGKYLQSIRERGGNRAVLAETKNRLFHQGEAQTAHEINQNTDGPVQDPMHV